MFCPQCGTQIPDNSSFCKNCGARLDIDNADAQPTAYHMESETVSQPAVKNNGGFPTWAVIVSVVAIVAALAVIAAVLLMPKIKKDKETEPATIAVTEETTEEETTVKETTTEAETETVKETEPETETEKETEAETEEETETEAETVQEEDYIIEELDDTPAPDDGKWNKDENGWWYQTEDNNYYAGGVMKIGKYYYGFNADGYMLTGWQTTKDNKWYYFDDEGHMAINEWVDDHFIGSDGVMVTNKWVGEYYVGDDGKWIPEKVRGVPLSNGGSVKPDQNSSGSQDAESIAKALSTEEAGSVLDFNWFLDVEVLGGKDSGKAVTEGSERITGKDNPLLNGGWKGYMVDTLSKPFKPSVERFFNVEIDTSDKNFNAKVNWSVFFDLDENKSYDDTGSDLFKGTWDPDKGTAKVECNSGMIEFDSFYLSKDKKAEYALGTFYWVSGEKERIGLIRVME